MDEVSVMLRKMGRPLPPHELVGAMQEMDLDGSGDVISQRLTAIPPRSPQNPPHFGRFVLKNSG